MRHVNYTLKPATIDNAKPREKAYALTDGAGLQLEVLPSGSRTWRFKYHLNGKREKVTIGAYPAFTIKQARDRHEELRALVERGQSPAKAKRVLSTQQKLADARRLTFRTFAQRWVDETLFYRSGGYVAQTVRWLDAYVYPAIGDMQLDEVQPGDVLAIIKARADTAVTAERKEDLHRWRETFAEKLRDWGIEAEASSQATRGVSRRSLRGWERQPGATARTGKKRGEHKTGPAFRATCSGALQAWAEITKALAASPDPADRKLSKSIVDFVMQTEVAQAVQRMRAAQRQTELPGMTMDRGWTVQRVLPEPTRGPDMSR